MLTPEQKRAIIERSKSIKAEKIAEEAKKAEELRVSEGIGSSIGSTKKVNVQASAKGGLKGGPVRARQLQEERLSRLEAERSADLKARWAGVGPSRMAYKRDEEIKRLRESIDPGSTWQPTGFIKPYQVKPVRKKSGSVIMYPRSDDPNKTVWKTEGGVRKLSSVGGKPVEDVVTATIQQTPSGFIPQIRTEHLSHQFRPVRTQWRAQVVAESGINRALGPTGDVGTSLKQQHLETGDVPLEVATRKLRGGSNG